MGYRRQKSYSRYNNNYAMAGGYDSTGRWRSEAWHLDGGANDEGWHRAWCNYCGKETEHGRGSGCVPCGDRMAAAHRRRVAKKRSLRNTNPHKRDRWAVLKLYEVSEGPLYGFLASLCEQNQKKCLSPKQVSVGAEILSKVLDSDIVDRLWSRTKPQIEDRKLKVDDIVRLREAVNPMKVISFDNRRNQVLLSSLESNSTTWASNDGRWVVLK